MRGDVMFEVIYYDYDEFLKFLKGIPVKLSVKITHHIQLLEEGFSMMGEPYSKSLGEGIFELRIKQSTNIARILYFYDEGKIIVIADGYLKKKNKTDKNILNKAKKIKKEYYNNKSK
jgi:phage-related protein